MKEFLCLGLTLVILQGQISYADTVLTVSNTGSMGNTAADHSRKYQINTASVGDWPGWYIDSVSVNSFVSFTSSYDPTVDLSKFNIRFYNNSGTQLGQYTASSVSSASSIGFGTYRFSVTYNLPSEVLMIPSAGSFYYSVERTDGATPGPGLNMQTRGDGPFNANGWSTGYAFSGAVGDFNNFLWYATPSVSVSATMVPEPSAFSLLVAGLGGLAILRRRRG